MIEHLINEIEVLDNQLIESNATVSNDKWMEIHRFSGNDDRL